MSILCWRSTSFAGVAGSLLRHGNLEKRLTIGRTPVRCRHTPLERPGVHDMRSEWVSDGHDTRVD